MSGNRGAPPEYRNVNGILVPDVVVADFYGGIAPDVDMSGGGDGGPQPVVAQPPAYGYAGYGYAGIPCGGAMAGGGYVGLQPGGALGVGAQPPDVAMPGGGYGGLQPVVAQLPPYGYAGMPPGGAMAGGGMALRGIRDGASPNMPGVHAAYWVNKCGGLNAGLGRAAPDKKVVVIGAGLTGVALCKQLALAGFDVTLLEEQDLAGGRLKSQYHGRGLFTVPAALRFGEASDLAQKFVEDYGYNIKGGVRMPNADMVPTLMFDPYTGQPQLRDDVRGIMPENYRKAYAGLKAFYEQPVYHNEELMFEPICELRALLEDPGMDPKVLTAMCQRVYNYTRGLDMEGFYTKVFVENSTPPGGDKWTKEDIAYIFQLFVTGASRFRTHQRMD